MKEASPYKYSAFISYSSKDKAVAKWLHRAIEAYRVPAQLRGRQGRDGIVPEHLRPVFRDRDELPTSADLGRAICDALERSRYLIVLCSPNSSHSIWVREEIRYFKMLGRSNRILCLIVSGEPNVSSGPDLAHDECFAPELRYAIDESGALRDQRVEPLAADIRQGMDGRQSAKIKLIAGLLGLDYDTLWQRSIRRARSIRLIWSLAIITILTLLGGVWYQGHLAEREAQSEQLASESRLLGATAYQLAANGRSPEAIELALQALPVDLQDPERPMVRMAERALRRAMKQPRVTTVVRTPGSTELFDREVSPRPYSADGRSIVFSHLESVLIFDPSTGALRSRLATSDLDDQPIAFLSKGGERVSLASESEFTTRDVLSKEILSAFSNDLAKKQFWLSVDGARLLELSAEHNGYASRPPDSALKLYDTQTGEEVATLNPGHPVIAAELSADGQCIVAWSDHGHVSVWNAGWNDMPVELDLSRFINEARGRGKSEQFLFSSQLAPACDRLLVRTGNGQISVFSLPAGELLTTINNRAPFEVFRFLGTSDRIFLSRSDGGANFWKLDGAVAERDGTVTSDAFSADPIVDIWADRDGNVLGALFEGQEFRIINAENNFTIASTRVPEVYTVVLSPDGNTFVTLGYGKDFRVHRVGKPLYIKSVLPEGGFGATSPALHPECSLNTDSSTPAEGNHGIVFSLPLPISGMEGCDHMRPLLATTLYGEEIPLRAAAGTSLGSLPLKPTSIGTAALSPNLSHLVLQIRLGPVEMWSLTESKMVASLDVPLDGQLQVGFTPGGEFLALRVAWEDDSEWPRTRQRQLVFNTASNQITIDEQSRTHSSVVFSESSRSAALTRTAGDGTEEIVLVDPGTGAIRHSLSHWGATQTYLDRQDPGDVIEPQVLAISDDDQYLASAGSDKLVHIWDATDGEVIDSVEILERHVFPRDLSISNDMSSVSVETLEFRYVWKLPTLEQLISEARADNAKLVNESGEYGPFRLSTEQQKALGLP